MTDEQFVEIKGSLARVETLMGTLVGNGQPGRIDVIETDIKDLQRNDNIRTGATSAFAFIFTGWEVVKHFWKVT